ncbi:hypothetical protein GCK72_021919 [Caenorhabditis remanei]|uniref:SCP domain-containing protein n=1 Tax=Caenorhabditis remanei TaxID=31234 RepID=A0A6A5GJB7_CAERE|nr:hypothetical protein GCK72_021919 [Caenorhabditis remanei]KAF1755350.1 hypothetical protein GCK72_021919 [Caenorhabditis remanei]
MVEMTDTDRKTILDAVNKRRRDFAKNYRIANMNEMTYDVGFEKIAEGIPCQTQANDYMVVCYSNDRGWKSILEVRGYFEDEPTRNLMIPVQTKFGCVSLKESCYGPTCPVTARCVVGPQNVFQNRDFKGGWPGTKCPSDRDDTDGLCTLKN